MAGTTRLELATSAVTMHDLLVASWRSTAAAMFRTNWVVSNPAEEYQRKVSHGQHD